MVCIFCHFLFFNPDVMGFKWILNQIMHVECLAQSVAAKLKLLISGNYHIQEVPTMCLAPCWVLGIQWWTRESFSAFTMPGLGGRRARPVHQAQPVTAGREAAGRAGSFQLSLGSRTFLLKPQCSATCTQARELQGRQLGFKCARVTGPEAEGPGVPLSPVSQPQPSTMETAGTLKCSSPFPSLSASQSSPAYDIP